MTRSPHASRFPLALAIAGALALAACETKVSGAPPEVQAPPSAPPRQTIVPPPPPLVTPTSDSEPEAAVIMPLAPSPGGLKVALLVPLSGANAAVGRAILDAAQMALFDVGDARFELVPRDTAAQEGADGAARAALAGGAKLILGPLLGDEVAGVAAAARGANVPVVTFSNNATVAQPGVWVMGLLPQAQVERVVVYAQSKGAKRFAALVPNNAFGQLAEETLRRLASGEAGEVVAVERYEPGAADVTPIVRRLSAAERRAAANGGAASPIAAGAPPQGQPPEVGFDAILLPEFGDRLLALAPLLPFYDIDPNRIRYLGISLWDDPRVAREPSLLGGWYAGPAPEARAQFTARFRQLYGREPPRIASLGYDAAALGAVLAKTGDIGVDRLTDREGFSGFDGLFRLRADGLADRGLAVIQVQRGNPRVIDPAPDKFVDLTN